MTREVRSVVGELFSLFELCTTSKEPAVVAFGLLLVERAVLILQGARLHTDDPELSRVINGIMSSRAQLDERLDVHAIEVDAGF